MQAQEFDYIVVDGVLLLEAGVDPIDNPAAKTFPSLFSLLESDLDWTYPTTPQLNTNNRPHTVHSGKAHGLMGYRGLLPYFCRSEAFFDCKADGREHGFEGSVRVTYPLREPLKDAWAEVGEQFNPAPGTGQLSGVVEFLETGQGGEPQAAYQAYSLDGVTVITGATAHKVEFHGPRKKARKEVILAAGALRTPQLLMLSGVGPPETLAIHGIPPVVECPEVGKNLIDHFALYQLWKLRDPERGLALGSPKLVHPALSTLGLPVDWAVNQQIPRSVLDPAVQKDKRRFGSDTDESVLISGRPLVETITLYLPIGLPADGSLITTSTMLLAATSSGTNCAYTWCSPHAKAMPDTAAMGTYIECEVPPLGMSSLTSQSSDEDFDARIRATGSAHHHPSGTVAIGKVVDADLRVFGVRNLRVEQDVAG
ncbi:hypothetical protein BDV19DRAFT_377803 [Aspergillus venezuelensis]